MAWLSDDDPVIRIDGVLKNDTTSDRDLGGRFFVDAGATIPEPLYLEFSDGHVPNGLLGQTVSVPGAVSNLKLRDGNKVALLIVDGAAVVEAPVENAPDQVPGTNAEEATDP